MYYSLLLTTALTTVVVAQGTPTASAPIVSGTIVQPSGQPQVDAPANSLNLGDACGADAQCKDGAQCWGSNVMIIRRCGNFNAACQKDSQCAYNLCNNGLCNGFIATSTSTTTAAPSNPSGSATTTASSGPPSQPPVTAPPGSLALGATCSDTVQCAGGAQCWASNAMLIKACGNFNAACTSNAQCAFNTCNNGLCNGLLANGTSANPLVTATTSSGSGGVPTSSVPSGGANPAKPSASTGQEPFSGSVPHAAASVGSLVVVVAGVFALLL